ncbi:hypothetical protein ACROYT_G006423 [Oculina patagonica]
MEFDFDPEDITFPLPDLDDLDLSELSYDSPSPSSSSSDCSAFDSPATSPLSSPASSHSPTPGSDCSSPSSSPTASRQRTRCRTPHCLKKEHASILRRNERERNRVKLVSDGFTTLRKHIPTTPANKKLSKVETLRTAIEYIKHLQRVLNESNRHERETRLLRQVEWLQGAYDLQALSRGNVATAQQLSSYLLRLPEIAPYPSEVPFVSSSVSLPNVYGHVN